MMTDGISPQLFGPWRAQPSAEQQAFRSNVRSLIDAIKNGDLASAQEAFAKVEETAPGKTGTKPQSPFTQLIAQLGQGLEADDIEAAKDALSAFEANRPSGPPPHGAPPPDGPSRAERSAFGRLVAALKSDDLEGAKDAYAKLLQAREEGDASGKSPIGGFLEQIGAALESDDLDSAQAALAQLARHRPHGGAVDVSA